MAPLPCAPCAPAPPAPTPPSAAPSMSASYASGAVADELEKIRDSWFGRERERERVVLAGSCVRGAVALGESACDGVSVRKEGGVSLCP